MPAQVRQLPLPDEQLYTIGELAKRWHVSRDHVERILKRGDMRHVMIGSIRRIPASAAAEYLNAHEQG